MDRGTISTPEICTTRLYDVPRLPQARRLHDNRRELKSILKLGTGVHPSSADALSQQQPRLFQKASLPVDEPQRRLFSAPLPRAMSLAAELADAIKKPRAASAFTGLKPPSKGKPLLREKETIKDMYRQTHQNHRVSHQSAVIRHCLLSPPDTPPGDNNGLKGTTLKQLLEHEPAAKQDIQPVTTDSEYRDPLIGVTAEKYSSGCLLAATDTEMPASSVPIGTTRPTPFTSEHLKPQTFDVAYGQLQVLPSRWVLIDFRVRERKRGHIGDELLLVAPSGASVSHHQRQSSAFRACIDESVYYDR
jgi:hypothetical protein